MALSDEKNPQLGAVDSNELQLPEANYGPEVKAMGAVLTQLRSLVGNLEGLLFNLQMHSHRKPDRPENVVVMDDGDFVEKQPHRLVKGFGCLSKEPVEHVHTTAEGQAATTPSS